MAAAEHPAVFTVAPWGYRVLTPWVAHAITTRSLVKAFRRLTVVALSLAGGLLFLYLRRLGHAPWAALLGVAAFALSGPVAEAAAYPFLAEPLTVMLEVAFLLALRAGAGVGALAVVAVLGCLSKEFFVLLLPLVWLERRHESAAPWRDTALVAAPAVLGLLVLRLAWVPHVSAPLPALSTLGLLAERLLSSSREGWAALLLRGVAPLAVLGACLPESRAARAPALYVAAVTLLPPFLNPVAFFPADIPRLLIYALPVAIPLALTAVARLLPNAPVPVPSALRPLTVRREAMAWAVALALAVSPLALLDHYRRTDLSGRRDGPQLLAVCRETWKAASRLERGLEVRLDPAREFQWGVSDPGELTRMRWFLRDGFGERAHYGVGPVVTASASASLLLPVLTPRRTDLLLVWSHGVGMPVAVAVNGHPLGRFAVGALAAEVRIAIPAEILFRGDNEITLEAPGGGVRLWQIAYQG